MRGAMGGPRITAKEWKAMAADSLSNPDFLFVAKSCRVLRTKDSLLNC